MPCQLFQIERLGRMCRRRFAGPLVHRRQGFTVRRRSIDRRAEIVPLSGEKQTDKGLAQCGHQGRRQLRRRPTMFGEIDEIFELESKRAAEWSVEVDL